MRNLLIFLMFASMTYGCTPLQVAQTAKTAKDIGCIVVTKESRAEIREKQSIKTNVCGDDI